MGREPADRRSLWLNHVQALNPDTDPDTIRLVYQVRRVGQAVYQVGENSLTAAGLSFAQYRILMGLLFAEYQGQSGLSPSTISQRQGTSRNTISALIRQLEADGLILRQLDESDRRRFTISLTEAGRSLVRAHGRRHLATMSRCFTSLDPAEKEQLAGLLDKLEAAIAAIPADDGS